MRRVAAKFLPRLLTGAQKENRVRVSLELFDRSNTALLSRFGPCRLFLGPEVEILTSSLNSRRFQTVEEIEENSTRDLCAIPQNTFQDAFQKKIRRGTFAPSHKTRSRTRSRTGKTVGSCVSRVEGSTLKETSLIKFYVKQ
jgi:hypothetical protein